MTTKQRTIVITAPYFPPQGGGLERYVYEIAHRLHNRYAWRVVVITSGERNGKDTKEESNGIIIYRLGYRLKFSNTPFSFRWFRKINYILREEKPDAINIHAPVPGIGDVTALLADKTPVIVTYHAGSMNKNRLVPDFFIWFYEHGLLPVLLNRANSIICASDFVRFDFLKKYIGKSETVTPAVDSTLFKPNENKKSLHPSILFVAGLGHAERHKGLDTLIDALVIAHERISDLSLVIVGDGTMRPYYENRVKELGLQNAVIFRGRLGGSELVEEYQKAHIFSLPSSNENFSVAILEAMASSLPVVATNIGGIPMLVEDGRTGFLIKPHDTRALAEKIIDLASDKEKAIALGAAGREKTVNGFDWDTRVEKFNEAFKAAVETDITRQETAPQQVVPSLGKLLTVCVLTYNSAKTIAVCLNSLIEQVNQDFNLLIVDDASTDETLNIVDDYKLKFPLTINVIKNGKHNIPYGRNLAIQSSGTDFVAFVDSDDRAEKHWTDIIINTFKSNPEIALLSGSLIFSGQNDVGEAIATDDVAIRRIFGKGVMLFGAGNSAFNKRILKNNYLFDVDFTYAEDLEIASRIQKSNKWRYIPEMQVYSTSRGAFKDYAVQMYRYGLWRIYYGFVSDNYRFVDFVPLSILIVSVIACFIFTSWWPLLLLALFSLLESLFVIITTRKDNMVSLLTFPAWIVKNYAWSLGVIVALVTLVVNIKLRIMLSQKKLRLTS